MRPSKSLGLILSPILLLLGVQALATSDLVTVSVTDATTDPVALAPVDGRGDLPPAFPTTLAPAPERPTGYAAMILEALETASPPIGSNAGEPYPVAVRAFYESRNFAPVWTDSEGPLPRAQSLRAAILLAAQDGLEPADYLTGDAIALFAATDQGALARLEAKLTWAYVQLVSDLASGRTVPNEVDPELVIHPQPIDPAAALERTLGLRDITPIVADYAPRHVDYRRLKAALAQYREIKRLGGWRRMSPGAILRPGARGPRVLELKQVLAERGETVLADADDYYDYALEAAVRGFQERHGLEADGRFGSKTLAELNTSVEQRIEQIKINMERRRWLPANLGARYAFVNLADYRLKVVFHEEVVFETRVVVGRAADRTPVFSDRMTYLVLNPYWHIPPTIAGDEMLPQLRADPMSLLEKGIRVYSNWSAGAEEIDPTIVDWSLVSRKRFPFKLRQDPGDLNALGRVKFMFPNKQNIYLHDTPAKSLFNETVRAFSHGCIRVENPFELARLLLSEDPRWTEERLHAQIASREHRTVALPHPINVHLTYLTAWVDDFGLAQFRRDVYGRDATLTAAIDASSENRKSDTAATPVVTASD